jgi:glucokinase
MVSDMQKTGKQRQPVLTVDLGGTKMIVAIISENGEVIARQQLPTLADQGPQAVIKRMVSGMDQFLKGTNLSPAQLSAICLATAGIIDVKNGIVTDSPNLPGWKNLALRSIVEEKYRLKTFLINDADAAALGEHRFGVGRGIDTLVLLTLGTGIGGGIVINGKLYLGATVSAAEIGHMVVDANGPRCACGRNGCLETLASGTAVAREAISSINRGEKSSLTDIVAGKTEAITAEAVYLAAKDGDSLSLESIARATYYLGIGVVNLVNIFNPEMVVMGGGMAGMGGLLLDPVADMVKKEAFPLMARSVRIVPAQLGNDAGVFGAAAFALEQ